MSRVLHEQGTDRYNVETVMMLNGLNAFLFQMFLSPLFAAVSAQKTLVCGGNSILAVVDSNRFTIRFGRADLQDAASRATGECMTSMASMCSDNPSESGSQQCLASAGSTALSKAQSASGSILGSILVGPVAHALDAMFSYLEGVVSGMQVGERERGSPFQGRA